MPTLDAPLKGDDSGCYLLGNDKYERVKPFRPFGEITVELFIFSPLTQHVASLRLTSKATIMMKKEESADLSLVREGQILQLIPVSRSTFRRWIKAGKFPAGFKITERITMWRSYVVFDWIKTQKIDEGWTNEIDP